MRVFLCIVTLSPLWSCKLCYVFQLPTVLLCNNNAFSRTSVRDAIIKHKFTGLDIYLKNLFSQGQLVTPV